VWSGIRTARVGSCNVPAPCQLRIRPPIMVFGLKLRQRIGHCYSRCCSRRPIRGRLLPARHGGRTYAACAARPISSVSTAAWLESAISWHAMQRSAQGDRDQPLSVNRFFATDANSVSAVFHARRHCTAAGSQPSRTCRLPLCLEYTPARNVIDRATRFTCTVTVGKADVEKITGLNTGQHANIRPRG
jgi:hypothetical protein